MGNRRTRSGHRPLRLRTRHLQLPLGLGQRWVVASDIHAHDEWMPAGRIDELVHTINAIDGVDAVLMPGDFVCDDASVIDWAAERLEGLVAPAIATLGNHDHQTDPLRIADALRAAGVEVLADECVEPAPGLLLAGMESLYAGGGSDAFIRDVRGPEHERVVVLVHEPAAGTRHAADLQLAGHTHHGQVRLPLLTRALVLPRHSEPYPQGLYHVDGERWVYTTAGVGYSTAPLRFRAPAEIVVVDA